MLVRVIFVQLVSDYIGCYLWGDKFFDGLASGHSLAYFGGRDMIYIFRHFQGVNAAGVLFDKRILRQLDFSLPLEDEKLKSPKHLSQ